MTLTYWLATLSAISVLWYTFHKRFKNLPPGPKGHFLIGNLSDLNSAKTTAYKKWFDEYGSIMHLQVLGHHTIILNSAQAASDLLDKRGAIYSDRPRLAMLGELVGYADWLVSLSSGNTHRERRSVALRYFAPHLRDWQNIQLESCRRLIHNISANPNNWAMLLRLNVIACTMRITYGYEVTRTDDHILKIIQKGMETLRNGPYLVDLIPSLKYCYSWLPGGYFDCDENLVDAKAACGRLRRVPFKMVRKEMVAGIASPSFVSTLLSQLPPDEPDDAHEVVLIRDAAASIYSAAVEPTVSLMYTFLGAMVFYPDVQRQAQNELDTVLGEGRMPTFDDRRSLPFIDGIVLEVLRWNVVTPLVSHMVTEKDEYLGYLIPKGSTVSGNMWAILRDPVVFPKPNHFDPSRFLTTTRGSDAARKVVESSVFGWGRRACPGQHVGHSALFIMISHILTCFGISKPVDDAGNEFEPVAKFDQDFLFRRALPVPCTIRVRRPEKATSL